MRFLICGLGSIGRRHLNNLTALGQEDVVLFRTGNSTLPDAPLAGLPIENDLGTALDRWRPECVVVSNPTALHLPTALAAAKAGCHLLIEKPVSHTLEGIGDLQAAVRASGSRVLVGYHFRFNPGLQWVERLLGQGTIGRVLRATAHWGEYLPDWHPWEDYRKSYSARPELGGGVLLTLSHPFDYLRWLLGEFGEVSAEAKTSEALGLDVEDWAEVELRSSSDASVNVHLDYLQKPPSHWLEIEGSEGKLRWESDSSEVRWATSGEANDQTHAAPAGFERNDMFLAEMRHFIDVAGGRADPVCGLEDGVKALQIALTARESARSGGKMELTRSGWQELEP